MKKITAIAASAVLAFSTSFALPSVASADPAPGNDAVNLCKAAVPFLDSIGSTLNLGNCVSFFNAGKPSANAICHFFGAEPADMGECVSYFNGLLNSNP